MNLRILTSLNTLRSNRFPITVRGHLVSDSLLVSEYKNYQVNNGNMYDRCEAYYVLKKDDSHLNPTFTIIFGIRILPIKQLLY